MEEGTPDLVQFTYFDATTEPDHPEAWPGQFGLGIKAANRRLYRSARHEVRAAVKAICDETRTTYRLEPVGSMPELRNDPELVLSCLPALRSALGEATSSISGQLSPSTVRTSLSIRNLFPRNVLAGRGQPVRGEIRHPPHPQFRCR